MTSRRPYIFRAIHQWIVDNGCTPHIVFNSLHPGVQVPPGHDKNNLVTLNISVDAVRDFVMDDEVVSFSARFDGRAMPVVVPLDAVMMIYARENLQGVVLSDEAQLDESEHRNVPGKKPGGPDLKLVE